MKFNPQPKLGVKKKTKKSSMIDFFKEIWDERPHVCQVTGESLPEFNVNCFSHVVPKSLAKSLAMDKENIWLVLPRIHYSWDFGDRSHPMFAEKRKEFERLKQKDRTNNQ